jgi:hypothetical protein
MIKTLIQKLIKNFPAFFGNAENKVRLRQSPVSIIDNRHKKIFWSNISKAIRYY